MLLVTTRRCLVLVAVCLDLVPLGLLGVVALTVAVTLVGGYVEVYDCRAPPVSSS